jgi:hypothetical protein
LRHRWKKIGTQWPDSHCFGSDDYPPWSFPGYWIGGKVSNYAKKKSFCLFVVCLFLCHVLIFVAIFPKVISLFENNLKKIAKRQTYLWFGLPICWLLGPLAFWKVAWGLSQVGFGVPILSVRSAMHGHVLPSAVA